MECTCLGPHPLLNFACTPPPPTETHNGTHGALQVRAPRLSRAQTDSAHTVARRTGIPGQSLTDAQRRDVTRASLYFSAGLLGDCEPHAWRLARQRQCRMSRQ